MTNRISLTSVEENIENVLRASPADQTGNVAVTAVVKCDKNSRSFSLSESAALVAVLEVSQTEPVANDAIESFEPSAWPQFLYFGVRVAIPDRDRLAFWYSHRGLESHTNSGDCIFIEVR